MRRSTLAAPAALLMVFVITGCSSVSTSDVHEDVDMVAAFEFPYVENIADPVGYNGLPRTVEGASDRAIDGKWRPAAAWVVRDRTIAVTTWGSGTCPAIPQSVEVVSTDAIVVNFDNSQGGCTFDLSAYTHEFALPKVVTDRPLRISFRFDNARPVDDIAVLD